MLNVLRKILQVSEWTLTALLPISAAARYVDPEKYGEPLHAILTFLIDGSFAVTVWLALALLAVKIISSIVDGATTRKKEIKGVLDALQKQYFKDVPADELFKHRVTLFKACKQWYWFGPSHLKMIARSGTAYQKTNVRFTIDDLDETRNEGVAGRAWFKDATISVLDLPNWQECRNPSNNRDCQTYAERGYVPMEKAAELGIKSKSISGTVVRDRKGQRWGVLVLDSRDPQGVSNSAEKQAIVNLVADLLKSHV